MESDFTKLLPNQEKSEERFEFIQDETLKSNLAIVLRYIVFLVNLERYNGLTGPILFPLYKDMIVQTATIVESCTHYIVRRYLDSNTVKNPEIMDELWIEERKEILLEIDGGERRVCGVVEHKGTEKFTKYTQFINLNRACKRAKIFSEKSFKASEILRESRNKIHLSGLSKVEMFYTKKDVDDHFNYASIVLKRIEEKLQELR